MIKQSCFVFWSRALLVGLSIGLISPAFAEFPKPGFPSCDFYEKAETNVNCAKEGCTYLKEYGSYYCSQFNERSKNWSSEAKKWVNDTGLCLQEMIYDNRDKRIKPCKQMEEFAFDAHPICYKQYRICELSLWDRFQILRVVRAVDAFTRRSLVQVLNVMLACLFEQDGPAEAATYNRLMQGSNKLGPDDRKKAGQIFLKYPDKQPMREQYFKRALSILLFGKDTRSEGVELYLQSFENKPRTANSIERFDDCMQEFGKGRNPKDCRIFMYGSAQKRNIEALKGYKQEISAEQINTIYQMTKMQ